MKKMKRVVCAVLGVSLLAFAGCKKDVEEPPKPVIKTTDVCEKSEMAELKTPVTDEASLMKVIDETLIELNSILGGMEEMEDDRSVSNPNAEAKTVDAAVKQIIDFANELVKQVQKTISSIFGEDVDATDIEDLLALIKQPINFEFDKDINIGQLKVSEWLDVVSEVVIDADESVLEGFGDISGQNIEVSFESKEDVKKYIYEQMGINEEIANAYLTILDDYVIVKKFYLGSKVNLDFDYNSLIGGLEDLDENALEDLFKNPAKNLKNDSTVLGADVDFEVSVAIENVNKFVSKVMDDEDVNLSLKGAALYVEGDADFTLLKSDVLAWISAFANPLACPTIKKANLSGTQQIGLAICTPEGEGGYITFTATEAVDASMILDLVKLSGTSGINFELSEEMFDKSVKFTVSVSDGDKTTFEQNYKYSEFVAAYGDLFGFISISE